MTRTFATEDDRLAALAASTRAKLSPMRHDLVWLDPEPRVRRLVEEALAEFYPDTIAANYAWDLVERIVRRAVAEAAVPPAQP
jgi:hypothetical protein